MGELREAAASAVVFQAFALFPWKTVLENVGFGPKMRGIAKAERCHLRAQFGGDIGPDRACHRVERDVLVVLTVLGLLSLLPLLATAAIQEELAKGRSRLRSRAAGALAGILGATALGIVASLFGGTNRLIAGMVKQFERLGGTRTIKSDVRVIAGRRPQWAMSCSGKSGTPP